MARKRAVSEIVAVTIMLAVIATSSFLALNNTSEKIIENQHSVHDMLELSGSQIQETVSIISKKSESNAIAVELLNYGSKNITVAQVMVDGINAPYTLVDSGGTYQDNKIIRNKILLLQIPKGGQTVQIITSTKNMLKITI